MSRRVLNPQQLKMFMSANEIRSEYTVLEGDRHSIPIENMAGRVLGWRDATDDDVFEQKLEEVSGEMYDSIWEHGVKHPVHLGTGEPRDHRDTDKPQIFGGHHRIAVMSDVAPDDLMPVLHHRGFWDTSAGLEGFRYR